MVEDCVDGAAAQRSARNYKIYEPPRWREVNISDELGGAHTTIFPFKFIQFMWRPPVGRVTPWPMQVNIKIKWKAIITLGLGYDKSQTQAKCKVLIQCFESWSCKRATHLSLRRFHPLLGLVLDLGGPHSLVKPCEGVSGRNSLLTVLYGKDVKYIKSSIPVRTRRGLWPPPGPIVTVFKNFLASAR